MAAITATGHAVSKSHMAIQSTLNMNPVPQAVAPTSTMQFVYLGAQKPWEQGDVQCVYRLEEVVITVQQIRIDKNANTCKSRLSALKNVNGLTNYISGNPHWMYEHWLKPILLPARVSTCMPTGFWPQTGINSSSRYRATQGTDCIYILILFYYFVSCCTTYILYLDIETSLFGIRMKQRFMMDSVKYYIYPFSLPCLNWDKMITEEWETAHLLYNWNLKITLFNIKTKLRFTRNEQELTEI